MTSLQVAVAQINPTVGDVDGNTRLITDAARYAHHTGADLMVTSELAVTGYPPEDLLLRGDFIEASQQAVDRLAVSYPDVTVMVGSPERVAATRDSDAEPRHLINAVHVLRGGHRTDLIGKQLLPDYSVFDETRWFTAGGDTSPVSVPTSSGTVPVGVLVCEDLWRPQIADRLVRDGARLLVVCNASPWHVNKPGGREQVVTGTADRCRVPVVYVNQVGGQDGIMFDGRSMVAHPGVGVTWRALPWRAQTETVDVTLGDSTAVTEELVDEERDVWDAVCVGVHDYVTKNKFEEVIIGLSGGIDSAVVATVAVEALGTDRVRGVTMPGPFSSPDSERDATELAARLGIRCDRVPINAMFDTVMHELRSGPCPVIAPVFGVTDENVQARLRGMVLMAVSNSSGALVLNTSNKSESAVGYTTLYGDMAGGFAPIGDVPKTMVYRLANWRNTTAPTPPIPESTLRRMPSAELAPGQHDNQTLPPYDVLDRVLDGYVNHRRSCAEIAVRESVSLETVQQVCRMVDRAEHKRRQAAPNVRISAQVFGRSDRRMPITSGWDAAGCQDTE